MRVRDLLAEPVIVGNTVCLATLGNNEILFVGSSIPANFDPNSGYLDSICFLCRRKRRAPLLLLLLSKMMAREERFLQGDIF